MSDGAAIEKPFEEMNEQEAILFWEAKSLELAALKEQEMTIRKKIFGLKFQNPREGTNSFDYGEGYSLSGQHKLTRSFIIPEGLPGSNGREPTIIDAVDAMIDELRQLSNEAGYKVERLVKWSPSLSASEYRELTEKERAVVDKYIQTKPGSPTLSFKRPSA